MEQQFQGCIEQQFKGSAEINPNLAKSMGLIPNVVNKIVYYRVARMFLQVYKKILSNK
jgi:hypothetical protein